MTLEANGFDAIVDPPPLSIDEENVAPFSLPQEALTFQPGDLALISKFAGGDQERKIHCNIELSSQDFDRIEDLRKEAKRLGRKYYISITVMATRYISYARGNTTKAIAMMDETQNWRTEYFGKGPLMDSRIADDFKHGVLYFTGRDFSLRPILIVRAERMPKQWHADGTGVERLIRMLVFCMEYLRRYMFIPGKIENIVVLVDLRNLGIADVPLKALKSIYSVLSHHYIVRVFKFYIVNMSYMLSSLVSVVKPILTDRQRQKLNFLKNVNECREFAALHHLEEDLGGTRPKITEFFPFPLLPGPFDSGSSVGARTDAVKNVHRALTPAGFRGRIWDRSKTVDENSQLEYTDQAEDIFNQCGVPVPSNCPKKAKEPEPVQIEEDTPVPTTTGTMLPEGVGTKRNIVSLDEMQIEDLKPKSNDPPPEVEKEEKTATQAGGVNGSDKGVQFKEEKPVADKSATLTGTGSASAAINTHGSMETHAGEPEDGVPRTSMETHAGGPTDEVQIDVENDKKKPKCIPSCKCIIM